MEFFIGLIAVLIVLAFVEKVNDKLRSIHWLRFLSTLIIGSIVLAVIFSFTAEGVLVIVGFYAALIVIALLLGIFSKNNKNKISSEARTDTENLELKQGQYKIARNLLDVLDDQTIAKKTELSIQEVTLLRLKTNNDAKA